MFLKVRNAQSSGLDVCTLYTSELAACSTCNRGEMRVLGLFAPACLANMRSCSAFSSADCVFIAERLNSVRRRITLAGRHSCLALGCLVCLTAAAAAAAVKAAAACRVFLQSCRGAGGDSLSWLGCGIGVCGTERIVGYVNKSFLSDGDTRSTRQDRSRRQLGTIDNSCYFLLVHVTATDPKFPRTHDADDNYLESVVYRVSILL